MNNFDLKFLGNCPICAQTYAKDSAVVVGRNSDTLTLHIGCVRCQSSVLVAVYSGITGLITNISLPTDLSRRDLAKVKKFAAITADDVLAIHQFLEDQRG